MASTKAKPTKSKTPPLTSLGAAITQLESEGTDKVLEALMTIRKKFIKEKDGVARLRQHGGLARLLSLIQTTNQKVLDVTLSILGNCCMEEKTRKDVLKKEGIEKLGKVIENVKVSSIQNRAVRTIANLALDDQCCKEIHDTDGLVEAVVKLLKDADDPECQQTYLRAIRLLCGNMAQINSLLTHEALRLCGETLKSELQPVYTAALKTIGEFAKIEYTNEMARQLLLSDVPATLLKLTIDDDRTVKETAQSYVLAFCKHPELRAGLGSAGAITMFIEKIQDEGLKVQNKYPLVNALCLCAHEAVNRVRIREAKGLELLMKLLDDSSLRLIHNRLISCLVCFLYDESSFEVLLSNRLVPILLHHLGRIARLNISDDAPSSDEDNNAEEALDGSKTIDSDIQEIKEKDASEKEKSEQTEKSSDQCETPSASQPTVEKVKSIENVDFKRSQSCPILPSDGALTDSGSRAVKYSMDSPTYQAISEGDQENPDDYFSGPKNIADAQLYFGEVSTGGMSPLSYSGAGVSPYRSPTGSLSPPYKSPQGSAGLSPYRSPAYSGPYSPLSVSSLASSHSPDTSPMGEVSPHYSVISSGPGSSPSAMSSVTSTGSVRSLTSFSPDAQAVPSSSQGAPWTPLASPFHPDSPVLFGAGSPMWSSGTSLQSTTVTDESSNEPRFSSEEEEGVLGDNPGLSDACVTSLGDDISMTDTCSSVLSTDPLFLDVASTSTAATDPGMFKVPSASARSTPSRSQSPSNVASRKKRRLSDESKRRIQRSIENNSGSAPSSPRILDKIIKQHPTYSKDDLDLNPELPKVKDPVKVTEHNLLVLLSRVSYTTNPSEHLVNQSCLNVLLDYVLQALAPFPRCGRILSRLAKNPHCFEPLILCLGPSLIQSKLSSYNVNKVLQREAKRQTPMDAAEGQPLQVEVGAPGAINTSPTSTPPAKRLKLDVNSATKHNFRAVKERLEKARELGESLLTNLSLVGESRFGRGLITHLLLTGDQTTRTKCATALAYIIRSRSLQKQMMIQHKGLESLRPAMLSCEVALCGGGDEPVTPPTSTTPPLTPQFAAIQSLMFLADELKVQWPQPGALTTGRSDVLIGSQDHDVTFVMDDGSHVTGSRTLLSATSGVFAAMLEGSYRESEQSLIKIKEAQADSFRLVIQHLHGCDIQTALETIDIDNSLDTLLEALALSDRYMLESLKVDISTYICTKHMVKESLAQIFEVACAHRGADLVKSCLQFVLSGELEYKEATETLREMFSEGHLTVAFDGLHKLICDKLNST